ncbi:MAG: PKD domain-containing protein, partial [Bacteroidales bacterium]|nr:PKD domain-containing protein [Bacteroidales bacterium]
PQIEANGNFDTDTPPDIYYLVYEYTDGNSCSDTAQRSVEVLVYPEAATSIAVDINAYCPADKPTTITLECTGPDDTYVWYANDFSGLSLGSGKIITIDAPTVSTEYLVRSETDCSNSSEIDILVTVYDEPISDFTVSNVCENDMAIFTDNSSILSGSITNWDWDFGDGESDNTQNTTHTFMGSGIQNITLNITSDQNCENSTVKSMEVYALPTVVFSEIPAICLEDGIQTLTQGEPIGGVYSGPGVNSATGTFDPLLAGGVGNYTLSYTYTDAENCVNQSDQIMTVQPMPEVPVDIAVDVSAYCLIDKPDQIQLSISNTIDVFKWYENEILVENLIGDQTSILIPAPESTTTYFVRSETSCGESVAASITITLFPTPVADFAFQNGCQQDEISWNNLSTISSGNMINWSWDFGDGITSTDENPIPHTYTDYGDFNIQLVVESDHACSSTKSQTITIYPKPNALFSYDTVCKGNTTSFTNTSEGFGNMITDFSWNFNEGEGWSSETNPNFIFSDWGLMNTELLINTAYNCKDTINFSVLVDSLPLADFTYHNPCKSNVVTFTDASDANGKTITNWLWNFGDGESATTENPQHVYAEAASFYDVSLQLTDSKGCTNQSTTQEVYVNPDFSVSIEADRFCVNREETLLAISNDANITLDSWEWWIDGSLFSTADEINLSYPNAGTHNIQLIGTLIGCTSGDELNAQIKSLPNTDFDYSIPNLDFPTQFTDLTTLDDPGASILIWNWNFDDNGATSTSQNPNYQYANTGDYQVSLYVLDDNTCDKKIIKEVEVNPKPTADFSFTNACEGDFNEFTDASTTSNGTIINWQWNFGESSSGSDNFSDLKDPIHQYELAGTYEVMLIVEAIGFDTIKQNVTVYHLPETQFNWTTPCLNEKISLNDLTIEGDGSLNSWNWTISDGSEFNEQNPKHQFPSIGNFEIKLLTIDQLGCKDSLTQTINILQPPTAIFDYTLNCLLSPTEFTNQSAEGSSTINSFQWDFGDGQNSIDENPQHIYTNTGNYQTSLLITNSDGCQHSTDKEIIIRPLPTSNFIAIEPLCEGFDISFNETSSGPGPINNFLWNMGDGTTYTTANISHSYIKGGDKNISLTVTDDWACVDTIEKNIYIVPEFTLGIDYFGLCTNTPADISGVVIDPPITMDHWEWLFHDGTSESGQNVVYTYSQSEDYNLQLTASKNGCEERYTEVLSVNPSPTADFIFGFISLDDSVQFIDKSTLNGGPAIIDWNWDFDDIGSGTANSSSLQNPKHIFSQVGDFDVTLTITDANGCSADTMMTLTVNPRPVAGFEWDLSCFGTDVQFVDTSSTSQGFITDWYWNFDDPTSGAFNQSTVQNPTHAFTAPGIYNVQLVVKAYGYDTIIHQVTVYEAANAAYSFNNPCQGSPVDFVDETTIGDAPIVSWSWDFDDGTTSSLQNPSHTYHFSGDYFVGLTVTDTNGCENTIIHQITIWQGPTAKFNYYSPCVGSLTYFIDKTIANGADIVTWDWSFGDPGSGALNFS